MNVTKGGTLEEDKCWTGRTKDTSETVGREAGQRRDRTGRTVDRTTE